MNYQLIMLPNPILVSNENLSDGDKFISFEKNLWGEKYSLHTLNKELERKCLVDDIWNVEANMKWLRESNGYKCAKVIAGIPELPRLDLSLIAGEIGYVDVEKISESVISDSEWGNPLDKAGEFMYDQCIKYFIAGFNANPKKYTEKDMIEFDEWLRYNKPANSAFNFTAVQEGGYVAKTSSLLSVWLAQKQPKVYNVEVEMEEVEYGHVDDYSKPHGFKMQPKITNNTIKVIKVL